jgi:putative tryptophan/tyrosine transport system substrate-binding protein
MRRREFITFAGSVVAWPLTAHVQQTALPVIGFVNGASRQAYAPQLATFIKGLSEVGYIVGSNVAIEYRWADGQYDRLPSSAADLVKLLVAGIAATSAPGALAAKTAIHGPCCDPRRISVRRF